MALNHIRDDASTKQSHMKGDFTVNLILLFILEVLGGEISSSKFSDSPYNVEIIM